ncbi:glycosyltransferase family 2 protein [Ruegeria sp. 2205SS24-7]|uniref:glycosyltransferase family 2 protein n=1 Tax=Ruegeria discodermiae TaxID=3064389 RepID=UPI002741A6F2|nr:glycosyltransferase family 2 protein [Ruegeria sp. 2205SS24-7]MDP5215753.1 glycosyltransferase family 2 protein [Ruegeria sp. 2205SS24-7]
MDDEAIYPDGFVSLLQTFERKLVPYQGGEAVLPDPDVDLDQLHRDSVQAPVLPSSFDHRHEAARKYQIILQEFDGSSTLWAVHAMCIAVLRRHDPPDAVRRLFLRIWREKGDQLVQELPIRWMMSAATTFADQGETPEQRAGGMGLSVLFDMIKLHDSERRVSGWRNDMAFPRRDGGLRHELAFGMEGYSLVSGDLDRNMLARLWRLAEADDALRPLGLHLLGRVVSDPNTVFARVRHYRGAKPRVEAPTDSWAVCTTTDAPVPDILRFVAHHLDLGAKRVQVYLDDPDSPAFDHLDPHPQVTVVKCDEDHWSAFGQGRPSRPLIRQSANNDLAYYACDAHWLCHLEVDEFLWSETSICDRLRALSGDMHCARIRPLEALAGDGSTFKAPVPHGPEHAERTTRAYPDHGWMTHGGLVSDPTGKLFARTGLKNINFRIHRFYDADERPLASVELDGMDICNLASAQRDAWVNKISERLRQAPRRRNMSEQAARKSVHEQLRNLEAEYGRAGLEGFYDEVFATDPATRDRLRALGLVRHRDLNLDHAVQTHFPNREQTPDDF